MDQAAEQIEGASVGPAQAQRQDGIFSGRYIYWTIFVFFLVNLVSQMDGVVLAMLAEPIRQELNLTDNQIGLLRFAFSAFYAIFGLLIGRLTDTWSRQKLLAISVFMFSVVTAVCGAVTNFVQLFIARIFVGIGEAGGVPTKYSMTGDIVPPEQRARALALITSGLGFGSMVGLVVAGFLADTIGWRLTFVAFGVPGLIVGALVVFTIKEPVRGVYEKVARQVTEAPSIRETLDMLRRNRSFVFIVFGFSATTFALTGVGYWMPSFLVRSHGVSLTEVGAVYGAVNGLGLLAGLALSAYFSPWLLRRDRAWEMLAPGFVNLAATFTYLAMFLWATSPEQIYALACMTAFFLGLTLGPASSAIQSTVPARIRGMAIALAMLISSFLGQGLAPWLLGYISDLLRPEYGDDSLRIALSLSPVVLVLGGVLYLLGSRKFKDNLVD